MRVASSALPLIALVVSVFTTLYGLGAYPLLQPDEGRNAEIAREMLVAGDWLVPHYNGLPYLDKPAFYFRVVATSLSLFGINEAAARLGSVLFAWGLLYLVYRFCRCRYDTTTASLAVMVLATMPLFVGFARIVIFDMALALFVSAAILSCFEAEEREGSGRRRYYALAAVSIGLATLVKGPVGFVVPTLVIAIHHALERRRGWWRAAFAGRNLAIFLALLLPWFVGVSLHHPDFPYYGIVKETLQRFTSNEFHRAAPAYYYAIIVALGFFPWSVLLPEAMVAAWKTRVRLQRADRLLAAWAVVVVLFFSLSQSKLPGYILSSTVPVSILLGRLFAASLDGDRRPSAVVGRGGLTLAIVAVAAAGLLSLPLATADPFAVLSAKTAAHLRDLLPLLKPLALLSALTACVALLGYLRRDAVVIFAAFVLFPLLLVPSVTQGIQGYAAKRSAKFLAQAMPVLDAATPLVCYMCFPNGLPFYLQRSVAVVSYRDGRELESNYVRFLLEGKPEWPEPMIREASFRLWLEAREQPIYLLTRSRDEEHLREILGRPDLAFSPLDGEYSGAWVTPLGPVR
jgi:4-amino-4-deoxy-L-arabinose transferase-like glycosyltransferase